MLWYLNGDQGNNGNFENNMTIGQGYNMSASAAISSTASGTTASSSAATSSLPSSGSSSQPSSSSSGAPAIAADDQAPNGTAKGFEALPAGARWGIIGGAAGIGAILL